MVKIKKVASSKHEATISPALSDFIKTLADLPLQQIPQRIAQFPPRWPFPRGDLYHWIPVLNRFDQILDSFAEDYGLREGPQTQDFGVRLLAAALETSQDVETTAETELAKLGFGPEGDRELVETILNFSRILLENCGNRSLYASSAHLDSLLNSTSLSLLSSTLRLTARLAQRYYAACLRVGSLHHVNNNLLTTHYNIDVEKIHKLAQPFIKAPATSDLGAAISPTTPTPKGKDKLVSRVPVSVQATDLIAIAKSHPKQSVSHGRAGSNETDIGTSSWEEWGSISLPFYPSSPEEDLKLAAPQISLPSTQHPTPIISTPSRRSTARGHPVTPLQRSSTTDSVTFASSGALSSAKVEEQQTSSMRTLDISASQIRSTPITELLKSHLLELPQDSRYDLLTRARNALALTTSHSTRCQILAIRILAITNLAYVHPEETLQKKILQQDSDEPRRLQLAWQLADLIQPMHVGTENTQKSVSEHSIPRWLQTMALGCLEALARQKSRSAEVCSALNVNVGHGVLLYVLRKAIASLATEGTAVEENEEEEWREALFSLLIYLPSVARTGEALVTAGLLPILVEALTHRSNKAERCYPKVLNFLDTFVYNVRDAFQTLANARGLDIISELTSYEVDLGLKLAKTGKGMPNEFRTPAIDYKIPFLQQQTLRWLFKFMNHMMTHTGANFDRLLRNLIDSPPLLNGLRTVLANAKTFGSNVWSGAVLILTSFINNEPTSYAVIVEAGLSKALLEAVTGRELLDEAKIDGNGIQSPPSNPDDLMGDLEVTEHPIKDDQSDFDRPTLLQWASNAKPEGTLAQGMIAAADAIATVPGALSAICLNPSGVKLFQASDVLSSFFEIFQSPEHLKCLDSTPDLPQILGTSFDELVRHHPQLRDSVMKSVINMVWNVSNLCHMRTLTKGAGAKLWYESEDNQICVCGGWKSVLGDLGHTSATVDRPLGSKKIDEAGDVEMEDSLKSDNNEISDLLTTVGVEQSSAPTIDAVKEKEDKKLEDVPVVTYIDTISRFLTGFFSNANLASLFVEKGGFDIILDIITSPSLPYDFNTDPNGRRIAEVVHQLVEQKPHLLLAPLLKRTQLAVDALDSFSHSTREKSFFGPLTDQNLKQIYPTHSPLKSIDMPEVYARGTDIVKSLVEVHTLSNVLLETLSAPMYNHHRSSYTLISQVNLTELHIKLVKSLGRLSSSCIWEEILLQQTIPDSWKEATRLRGPGLGNDDANNILGFLHGDEEPNEAPNGENSSLVLEPTGEGSQTLGPSKTKATLERDTTDAQFKNVRTLRYLLSQIPSSITPFFQSLGKALIPKRSTDTQPRQNGALIAGAMAEAMLEQLRFPNSSDSLTAQDRYSYWIVTLTSLSQYLMDDQVLMERPHPQCLTLVLQAFKNQGGLEVVIDILRTFVGEVERLAPSSGETSSAENAPALLTSAYGGIKIILTLFSQIVNSRNIVDAVQTTSMMSRHNDREKPDYFLAQQFIVELRMAILPVVREVWDSTFMDKASSSLAKNMIEILKTILESGNEDGAFKRSDKVTLRVKTELKPWKFNLDHLNKLVNDSKFDQALAREALYRCYGNFNLAQEYCRTYTDHPRLTRNYIPEQEILRQSRSRDLREGSSSRLEISVSNSGDAGERSQSSAATSTTNEQSPAVEQPHAEAGEVAAEGSMPPPPPPALTIPAEDTEANERLLAMSIDNLGGDASSSTRDPAPEVADAASRKELGPRTVANVDDLNDERASLRTNLVERSLNVLHFHGDVTFELSDLMTAAVSAVSQSSEKESMRKEIGSTLVLSLTSLQSEDGDLPKVGKRIASYAHLLGLILQDKTFYDATLPELRDNLSVLLGFVKASPDSNAEMNEESSIQDSQAGSPWISHILLVIEKLLAEDAQPRPIKWQPPSGDVAAIATQEPYELAVSSDEKQQLLNAIMDILPSVGKDESLALSAVRILVILTRDWKLASQLKERSHLQRLLGMMQKMAGKTTDKLQGSIILVLRHIIEDKDVISQIMRSEIRGFFNGRLDMEIPRQPRQHDTNLYMRNLSHSILRSPELFVDVTNELVKLTKFDPSQRHQSLALKPTETPGNEEDKGSDQKSSEGILATGSRENKPTENTNGTLKPQSDAREAVQAEKAKTSEVKIPNIPPTDGVIHFLLSETLKYKDLEDKEPATSSKNSAESRQDQTNSEVAIDVDMIHDGGSIARTSSPVAASSSAPEPNKREKIVFKAEHHPNFVYRCFLLQCLTELLVSYNCTKTEFLNFRQRAPHTQPSSTPSRPRSSVLSYLLHDVIPIGTLEHGEDLNFRKRQTISSCALNVVVALCSITDERGSLGETRTPVGDVPWISDQSELTHVRKVVLDTSLKAYKDANSSMEPLGLKYSRMLNISELFNRFLLKNNLTGSRNVDPGVIFASQKELARMMFERGFIPALTNSLADIDLNFPQAKRLVKYILRPLKGLTDIAIELSQTSNPPVILGQLDIDDASSASSVSVIDDDREETPDLFRNSTLGMFEPGGQENSSSESEDDEEMYDGDDGYGDEMDYEEEMGDSGDVVSDDDEDLDGVGPIEGLPGDVGVNLEVVIDEDDETDEDDESSDSNDNDDIEVVDSLNGHQDGASDVEPGDHEWTDEAEDFEGVADDDGDDDEDDEDDADLVGDMGDAARDILGALRDSEPPMLGGDLVMNMEGEGYMEDDMDDEEDQDDEEMDDDDVFYEPEYDDDDLEGAELRWGWDSERPPPVMAPRRTHHHHHHRGPSPWSMFHGLPRDPHLAPPTYRSRGAGIPATRPSDEGINPLLQRNSIGMPGSSTRIGYPEAMSDWVHAIDPGRPSHGILNADSQVSFIYNIFNAMNQGRNHLGAGPIDPHGEGLAFHISPGSRGTIPRELHNLFGMRHLQSEAPRVAVDDPSEAIVFAPGSTSRRWTEESRILFGLNPLDKTQLILNALLSVLVPPALAEAEIRRAKEERDSADAAKKRHEEIIAQEEAARKEKEAKELEARTAAAQAAAEVAAAAAIQAQTQQNDQPSNVSPEAATGTARGTVPEVIPEAANEQVSVDQPMEDAGPSQAEQPPTNAEAGPSENPAARVFVNFHGRQIDITDLAIDPEYLDALPEEMREEVLVQQFAEHRSQAAESGEPPPTDLDRDFLEALPDEIREELLQHEADERRRREREEARRQAAETGTVAPQDNEMDPADFLASLDPGLRQSVLLESPEEMINQLPPELAAEARALGGDRRLRQFMDGGSRLGRGRGLEHDERHLVRPERRTSRKTIVQMLDKPGVATLLRLMFIPQQGSSRSLLSSTLRNVCENRQNRIEVVSLLLSILQDGSADMNAVERSFNRLSLRARQPAVSKDKMALERPAMLQGSLANSEISPLTVVQQCLGTLVSLTQHNHRDLSLFFLTEHDPPSALKRNRKGKGKEVKSSKYALNALLVLLDRKLIMESSNAMEQLSQLLNTITQPLGLLLREGIAPKPVNETAPVEDTQTAPPLANGTEANPEQQQQNSGSEPTNATESNSNGVDLESEQTQTDVLPQNVVEHTQEQGIGSLSGEPTATLLNTNGMEVSPDHDTEDGGAEQASNERTVVPEQKPEDERTKKTRIFNPPIIPEENLRLVVNILAARECSGKTFRETLSTINNLSRIPGTKIVFGQELHSQADDLAQLILGDLTDLLAQIDQAEPDTDVQGLALAKFSPASSDQAKFLRILTALDYINDPKHGGDRDKPLEASSTTSDPTRFGPLWAILSRCLTEIHKRPNMLNAATILLPLIEALMVVCQNTTLKDAPVPMSQEFAVSSPPPEDRIESLFFKFTEDHRKILNDLVRHNPKLMSGNFSLLVKNPKVLEFDNKRNYFNRRLHSRGNEIRQPQPPLALSLRREYVFLDSFKSLYFKTGKEMKYGKLSIRFHGEEGVDAGGVTREWFQALARQMFDSNYVLFTPVASDRTTFHPNRLSVINEQHLMFFKFIGRIIGKALYEGRVLDCHFSRAVYKRILGKTVSVKDMETLDLDYYKSLKWMLDNDITDIITETFSLETDDFGKTNIIDLKPDGRNIPVTEENKQEYVQLVVEHRLTGSVKEQLENFLTGFHDIVPAELISIFNEQELELLISGLPDIDVDDWKSNTEYHGYTNSSKQIQWFWRAVRSFDKEERAKLLQFVTGTSKVPLNGFKDLEGMNGISRFNIHRDYGNKDRLPSSHTCFNQLDLPEYDGYEALRKHVHLAITAGNDYFGFA